METFLIRFVIPAITAGLVATAIVQFHQEPSPPVALAAKPKVIPPPPLDPSPFTPQQRIDDAWDAMRLFSRGVR